MTAVLTRDYTVSLPCGGIPTDEQMQNLAWAVKPGSSWNRWQGGMYIPGRKREYCCPWGMDEILRAVAQEMGLLVEQQTFDPKTAGSNPPDWWVNQILKAD